MQKLPGTEGATAQALAVEERGLAQIWQQTPNGLWRLFSNCTPLWKKGISFFLKADQNAIPPWLLQLILPFFNPKPSCAHTKCETIAPNFLVFSAEELNIASSITCYTTEASKTKSVNLIYNGLILLRNPHKAFGSLFFKGKAFVIIGNIIATSSKRFNTEDKITSLSNN